MKPIKINQSCGSIYQSHGWYGDGWLSWRGCFEAVSWSIDLLISGWFRFRPYSNWWNIWPVKDRNYIARWWFHLFSEMIQFDQYFSDGLKPPTSKPPARSSLTKIRSLSNEGPMRQVPPDLKQSGVRRNNLLVFVLGGMLLGCFGSFFYVNSFSWKMSGTASTSTGTCLPIFCEFLIAACRGENYVLRRISVVPTWYIYIYMILPAHTDPGMQKNKSDTWHPEESSNIPIKHHASFIFFFDWPLVILIWRMFVCLRKQHIGISWYYYPRWFTATPQLTQIFPGTWRIIPPPPN